MEAKDGMCSLSVGVARLLWMTLWLVLLLRTGVGFLLPRRLLLLMLFDGCCVASLLPRPFGVFALRAKLLLPLCVRVGVRRLLLLLSSPLLWRRRR